jgi:hypothetical protein
MNNDAPLYVKTVLDLYLSLPDTPSRISRSDRQLALHLFDRDLPFATVEAALLLATARRLCRPTDAHPLGPIRSLHYFLPVIDEIIYQPLPHGYLYYLRQKLASIRSQPSSNLPPRS